MGKSAGKTDMLLDLDLAQKKERKKSDFELIEKEKLIVVTYKNKSIIYTWFTRFFCFSLLVLGTLIACYAATTMFPIIRMYIGITEKEITEIREIIINVFSFMAGGIIGRVVFKYFS